MILLTKSNDKNEEINPIINYACSIIFYFVKSSFK